jgi:hypothetical protein
MPNALNLLTKFLNIKVFLVMALPERKILCKMPSDFDRSENESRLN